MTPLTTAILAVTPLAVAPAAFLAVVPLAAASLVAASLAVASLAVVSLTTPQRMREKSTDLDGNNSHGIIVSNGGIPSKIVLVHMKDRKP
ncbi:hypothetical protein DEO72_LG9g633 [Vigna unguiculata]|uniref:Uncharacterized protein n=1 Tax=Vigna unguiculata TaxID=3917 RepID=A0A4D6MZM1_VIGUN|nr:hypothetical protein DEO72_LG9g633 [Vigna unguiculata]